MKKLSKENLGKDSVFFFNNFFIRKIYHAYSESPNQYIVSKEPQRVLCQCKESTYEGLPCRHELALCLHLLKDPKLLFFESRWRKDFYKPKEEKQNEEQKDDEEKKEDEERIKRVKVKSSKYLHINIDY